MIVRTTTSCLLVLLLGVSILQTARATRGSWLVTAAREFFTSSPFTSTRTTSTTASTSSELPNATARRCQSEEHLDFQDCSLEDLDRSALKSICDRMGIDIHELVFPFIIAKERDAEHKHYVRAAYECLVVEKDIHDMIKSNDIPEEYIDADPDVMADMLLAIFEDNPEVLKELETKMKEQDPDLWRTLRATLEDSDETSPELLADALRMLSD